MRVRPTGPLVFYIKQGQTAGCTLSENGTLVLQNNHSTILPDGSKVKKYRLPRNKELQQKYTSILKTSGINFNTGYICAEHWSEGYRESTADLADVPVPSSQFLKLRESVTTPKAKKQIHTLKRNLNAAERIVARCPHHHLKFPENQPESRPINKSFPPQSKSPQCTQDNFTNKIIVPKKHH